MFCGLRANCLESKVSSDKELCHIFLGYPCASRRSLKFARHSSNVVFEEFVLSSLTALLFALHERLLAARQLEGYNRMQPIGMTRGLSYMMVFARFQSISL